MFDGFRWFEALDNNHGAYVSLYNLLLDREAINTHLQNVDSEIHKNAEKDELQKLFLNFADKKDRNLIVSFRSINIAQSFQVISCQMIVVIVTILDGLLADFIKCIFLKFPERMYDYISTDPVFKGKVDLKVIIQATSKRELIYTLADSASQNATLGKFTTTKNNLLKLTKNKIDATMMTKISKIVEQRNRIVHESEQEEITYDQVVMAFSVAMAFVAELERVGKELGVPVIKTPDD